jgi:hypothetical protein
MVASHRGAAERHLDVGATGRVERAGSDIAKIDDEIRGGRLQVSKDRL